MGTKKKVCNGNDCLFCSSKCPECGSIHISIKFKPIFEFTNDNDNHISIHQNESELELECQDCGESIYCNDLDYDKRLWPLERALLNVISAPDYIDILHDSETGKISIEQK